MCRILLLITRICTVLLLAPRDHVKRFVEGKTPDLGSISVCDGYHTVPISFRSRKDR